MTFDTLAGTMARAASIAGKNLWRDLFTIEHKRALNGPCRESRLIVTGEVMEGLAERPLETQKL